MINPMSDVPGIPMKKKRCEMRTKFRKPPGIQADTMFCSEPHILSAGLHLQIPVTLRIGHRIVHEMSNQVLKHENNKDQQ